METNNTKRGISFFELLYGKPQAKPRWQREPFHLGLWFDVAVALACIVVAVGYLTA